MFCARATSLESRITPNGTSRALLDRECVYLAQEQRLCCSHKVFFFCLCSVSFYCFLCLWKDLSYPRRGVCYISRLIRLKFDDGSSRTTRTRGRKSFILRLYMKSIRTKKAKVHFAYFVQRDQLGINRKTLNLTQSSILM